MLELRRRPVRLSSQSSHTTSPLPRARRGVARFATADEVIRAVQPASLTLKRCTRGSWHAVGHRRLQPRHIGERAVRKWSGIR